MKTYRIWSTKDPLTRALISQTPLEDVLVVQTNEETTICANNPVHASKALLELTMAYEICIRGRMPKEITKRIQEELLSFTDLVAFYAEMTYGKNE